MPQPRSRRSSRASAWLREHLDRVHGALLVARPAAGTAVVVEPVAVAYAELDDGVLRARGPASIALEAVAARQAPARLVGRRVGRQAAHHLREPGGALLERDLR